MNCLEAAQPPFVVAVETWPIHRWNERSEDNCSCCHLDINGCAQRTFLFPVSTWLGAFQASYAATVHSTKQELFLGPSLFVCCLDAINCRCPWNRRNDVRNCGSSVRLAEGQLFFPVINTAHRSGSDGANNLDPSTHNLSSASYPRVSCRIVLYRVVSPRVVPYRSCRTVSCRVVLQGRCLRLLTFVVADSQPCPLWIISYRVRGRRSVPAISRF